MRWQATRAHSLARGDIVTLDEVTEAVRSVSTDEKGKLVIDRQSTAPVTLDPNDLVEVYR